MYRAHSTPPSVPHSLLGVGGMPCPRRKTKERAPAAGTSRQAFPHLRQHSIQGSQAQRATDRGDDGRFASTRAGPIFHSSSLLFQASPQVWHQIGIRRVVKSRATIRLCIKGAGRPACGWSVVLGDVQKSVAANFPARTTRM